VIELPGWLDPKIADAMRELILKQRPSVMVEIGVFAGKSLINSALALKENGEGVIYGIDPWRNKDAVAALSPNDNHETWFKINLDDIHTTCMHAIWEHELDNVVIIRATSKMAAPLFRFGSIDSLYIDGGHSEECATWDTVNYLPKVKRGGYIWIDDADWPSLQNSLEVLRMFCTLEQDFGCAKLYKKV
jgi:predicted O-methyltransferase YrrM